MSPPFRWTRVRGRMPHVLHLRQILQFINTSFALNFGRQYSQRLVCGLSFCHLTVFTLLLTVVLQPLFATKTHAGTVTAIYRHGALAAYDAPVSYGVFRSSLFFSSGDRLIRLDGIDALPIALKLPVALGRRLPLRAYFTEFDGALFMHARRHHNGSNGYFLHKITNRLGRMTVVDVAAEPDTREFSWIENRDYADHSREFAELNGKLYFFAARAIPSLDTYDLSHALFRLNHANAKPQQVFWEDYFNVVNPHDLAATSMGIVFRATSPGVARLGYLPQSYIYQIENPTSRNKAPDSYRDYSVASAKRISGRTGDRELIVFDNKIYYAGEHHGLNVASDYPNPGPYPDPGRVKLFAEPWQAELYRHDPSSGNVWFDLHPLNEDMAQSIRSLGAQSIGSSNPDSFVIYKSTFYFRALSDGTNADMFRLRVGDPAPTRMPLNSDGPSNARPIGDYHGALWFAADIGAGYDLHYLPAETAAPVPLNVGERVARSSRAFVAFDNHVVFTARADDGQWWTYAANVEPDITTTEDAILSTKLFVNGVDSSATETIQVEQDSPVRLNCKVTNMTTEKLEDVRIVIRQNENYGAAVGSGASGVVRHPDENSRYTRQSNSSLCTRGSLDRDQSVNCRLEIRAGSRDVLYACIGSTDSGVNSRIRVQTRAIVASDAAAPAAK